MALMDLATLEARDGYIARSGTVDDALTRACEDVVRLRAQAGGTAMSDDVDDDSGYDDGCYPSIMYQNPKAEMVQALGNFAAVVGRIPAGHPMLAPAISAFERFTSGIETPPRGDVVEVRKRTTKAD